MDKTAKTRLILIVIALVAGALIGSGVTGRYANIEKDRVVNELIEQHKLEQAILIDIAQQIILKNHKQLDSLQKVVTMRGDSILNLQRQIKADGVRVEQRRREAAKMTTHEKIRWLVNRYRTVPKS